MNTESKTTTSGSADPTEPSCCGQGGHPPVKSEAPSVRPEQSSRQQRPEDARGASKGCCCGN